MATLLTALAALQPVASGADTWSRAEGIDATGELTYLEAVYTLTSGTDETSGDVIRICRIPDQSVVIPHLCKIIAQNPGTAFNIATIGDAAVFADADNEDDDADRYSGAIDISAGGAFDFAYAAKPAGLAGYKTKEERWLTATLGTVTAPTAGQTIRFVIALAVSG
jgi:hypothetical protein